MAKPRLLWAYDHPTGRYQEVRLWLDAGAEVIVALGDPASRAFDANYHNEVDPLYPDWRPSVTLASDVVERIRRISLFAREGALSLTEAALLNAHVDGIILASDVAVVDGLAARYSGRIFYRQNGAHALEEFARKLEALQHVRHRHGPRVRYVPALKRLLPVTDSLVGSEHLMLPVWVDAERLTARWQGASSRPYVATAISYIGREAYFTAQYRSFAAAAAAHAFVVLGKNDRRAGETRETHILGALSTPQLHAVMASARLFVDPGSIPEHLIFPPLEAMAMGVPVLFTATSALAEIAREHGTTNAELDALGNVGSFDDLGPALDDKMYDISGLEALAARQKDFFMSRAFARPNALAAARLALAAMPLRKPRWQARNSLELAVIRTLPFPLRSSASGGMHADALLPGAQCHPQAIKATTGRIVPTSDGRLVRSVRPLRDRRGFLAIDYLPPLDVGSYRLIFRFAAPPPEGAVTGEIGEWRDGCYVPAWRATRVGGNGGVAAVTFVVDDTTQGWLREVRLFWHGKWPVDLASLSIDQITQP